MTSPNVGKRLESYVLDELDRAAQQLAPRNVRRDGIHAARKSLRRARAALRLARKVLGEAADSALDASGDIGTSLAPLRDAHVAVTTLAALAAQSGSREERALLRRIGKAFAARRKARFAEFLARDKAFSGHRSRLRELRDALAALSWRSVTAHALRKALDHDVRHAGQIGQRAHASTDGDLRHLWRRRLRRLRYELRAAAHALGRAPRVPVTWSWPSRARKDAVKLAVQPKALGNLTDRLGLEHDLRVLYAALAAAREIDAADRTSARRIVRRAIAAASGTNACAEA